MKFKHRFPIETFTAIEVSSLKDGVIVLRREQGAEGDLILIDPAGIVVVRASTFRAVPALDGIRECVIQLAVRSPVFARPATRSSSAHDYTARSRRSTAGRCG